jgi:hypothetical protein
MITQFHRLYENNKYYLIQKNNVVFAKSRLIAKSVRWQAMTTCQL